MKEREGERRELTCTVTAEAGLRCWRRAETCDGDHFTVLPNVDKEVRTRPQVYRWSS